MSPSFQLFARDGSNSSTLSPTMIAGIVVAAVLVAGCAIWLSIYTYRRRSAAKREDAIGASFLAVRGLVREDEEKGVFPDLEIQGATFSRNRLTPSIVMPEKVVLRAGASRDEIIRHHATEGTLPRPFAPFAAGADGGRNSMRPASTASFLTIDSSSYRTSIMSSRPTSVASFASSDATHKRKVRQLFNPALPDELVVSLGERLSVIQSYDDGWCIVGRDSLMKKGEAELGAVPAWCFLKPVKGLRAERPIRTSSLGVTVVMEGPGSREDVISWSNFS
ncbi:hypothetical protein BKA93DRAFT_830012 [Sparassis latifolia]|uniref:SH3 domain-containing protein n=1 Tax=Sparassis crispa TaxID=139825 RepID=A0A401H1N1_9APHY|nr:hypothetical protein SCP_1301620 [Sparassis crispa]GBE88347.1 hypothetical protein SCP_1301620 [Sparassis crispa]